MDFYFFMFKIYFACFKPVYAEQKLDDFCPSGPYQAGQAQDPSPLFREKLIFWGVYALMIWPSL